MWIVLCGYSRIDIWIYFFGGGIFSYSTLLRLPPLRIHCADGCWDRTQDRLQLVHRQSDALWPLDLIRWIYLCHLIFILAWNFFFIIYIFLNILTFLSTVELSLVCEIIFLFLATWVAPLSSHFSTLGCWNLLSPGNFHLWAEGAEIRFREILCAILHFIIPFTKASRPPPPLPFLPPHLFSPPNFTTHVIFPHYLSFCFSTPPFF